MLQRSSETSALALNTRADAPENQKPPRQRRKVPPPAHSRAGSEQPEPTTLAGLGHNHGPPLPFDEADTPLVGGEAIWRFHNELLGINTSLSAIFKQLAKGDIPANKTAGTWISSTRKMRAHYARTSNTSA